MQMRQWILSNDESWPQLGNEASSSQSGHSTASHDSKAGRLGLPPDITSSSSINHSRTSFLIWIIYKTTSICLLGEHWFSNKYVWLSMLSVIEFKIQVIMFGSFSPSFEGNVNYFTIIKPLILILDPNERSRHSTGEGTSISFEITENL